MFAKYPMVFNAVGTSDKNIRGYIEWLRRRIKTGSKPVYYLERQGKTDKVAIKVYCDKKHAIVGFVPGSKSYWIAAAMAEGRRFVITDAQIVGAAVRDFNVGLTVTVRWELRKDAQNAATEANIEAAK